MAATSAWVWGSLGLGERLNVVDGTAGARWQLPRGLVASIRLPLLPPGVGLGARGHEGWAGGGGQLKLPAKNTWLRRIKKLRSSRNHHRTIWLLFCPCFSPSTRFNTSLSSQLGGGALLGVGIWVTVDGQSFLKIFGTLSSSVLQVVNVSYFLIVIGAILVIIGFLGCYGAQKESKCLLMMVRTGPRRARLYPAGSLVGEA